MSNPIRRGQAIAPFGPGAIVDFPGPVSMIHAGLDAWPFSAAVPEHREFRIDDEYRLARRLGVDFFVQPPDFRRLERGSAARPNVNLRLPFLRFPLWHVCPRCGRMFQSRLHARGAPSCEGPVGSGTDLGKPHGRRKAFQVRFVAACRKGHLRDFPWVEWVFGGNAAGWSPNDGTRWLRMLSSGSASLAGVGVAAEESTPQGIKVVAKRTLAGAFDADLDTADSGLTPLGRVGVHCNGANPVLARGTELRPSQPCGQPLFALLKSASNLYFPSVVSSIFIPQVEDENLPQAILDLLADESFKSMLTDGARLAENGLVGTKTARLALSKYHPEAQVDPALLANAANKHLLYRVLLEDRATRTYLEQMVKASVDRKLPEAAIREALARLDWAIDPKLLLDGLGNHFNATAPQGASEDDEETIYRKQEYRFFSRDAQVGFPKTDLEIKSEKIEAYGQYVNPYLSRVALLVKMRETRAFQGFGRLMPTSMTRDETRALFSEVRITWLPAIVVRGEGFFLQFDLTKLSEWEFRNAAQIARRVALMQDNARMAAERRGQPARSIEGRFVMMHTFAHLLINELVNESGYSSAALRERIYSSRGEQAMSGVLIYTAAGDSEGTMGGLVRLGRSDRLDAVIAAALERSTWCSTDPICIESTGQGPDNCNLASCHSCGLLPETSCEEQNRYLDRGLVLGTLENPELGYFSGALAMRARNSGS